MQTHRPNDHHKGSLNESALAGSGFSVVTKSKLTKDTRTHILIDVST